MQQTSMIDPNALEWQICGSAQPISLPSQVTPYHCLMVGLQPYSDLNLWINGSHYQAAGDRGTIGIYPSGTALGIESNSLSAILLIWLHPNLLKTFAAQLNLSGTIRLVPYTMGETIDTLILELGLSLIDKVKQGDATDAMHREVIAKVLALHLLTYYSNQEVSVASDDRALTVSAMDQAKSYIDENLGINISQDDIAHHLNISKFYFARQFKQAWGIAPHQYIIQKRIAKAQLLLKNTQKPISDIALECGFTNQSHLNLHFKRILGITPGKFRQNPSQ